MIGLQIYDSAQLVILLVVKITSLLIAVAHRADYRVFSCLLEHGESFNTKENPRGEIQLDERLKKVYYAIFGNVLAGTSCLQIGKLEFGEDIREKLLRAAGLFTSFSDYTVWKLRASENLPKPFTFVLGQDGSEKSWTSENPRITAQYIGKLTAILPQMDEVYAIGKVISQRPEKGTAVVAAESLQANFLTAQAFPRATWRMRNSYKTYKKDQRRLWRKIKQLGVLYIPQKYALYRFPPDVVCKNP